MCYREAIPAVSCLKCNIPTLPYWNFAVLSVTRFDFPWSILCVSYPNIVPEWYTLSPTEFLSESYKYAGVLLNEYEEKLSASCTWGNCSQLSLFFLALRELLEFWCTGGKWVKADWEAKDGWTDVLHGCLSHPLSVSFLLFSIILQPLLGKTKVSWQLLQLHS